VAVSKQDFLARKLKCSSLIVTRKTFRLETHLGFKTNVGYNFTLAKKGNQEIRLGMI